MSEAWRERSVDVARWVIVREAVGDRRWVQTGAVATADRPIVVGREGDLAMGVVLEDAGVSRSAITVTATTDGWRIGRTNRNGAVIHPWGLAPSLAAPHTIIDWPLVAVRVVGSSDAAQHWLLLESRIDAGAGAVAPPPGPPITARSDPPKPLTAAEMQAIWTVFGDVLAWPPQPGALPLQLKQASRRLRITDSAVQLRLDGAQRKALALGLPRAVRLTEPDYLHVLVGAGYVPAPRMTPVSRALRHAGW